MNPIKVDPEIMSGTPCFAGTRVPIQNLFDSLKHGRSLDYFLHAYPTVEREQVIEVIGLAEVALGFGRTARTPVATGNH